jgi:hypothetical protein
MKTYRKLIKVGPYFPASPFSTYPSYFSTKHQERSQTNDHSLYWIYILKFTVTLAYAKKKQSPWLESASELYRPSDCSLSVKLLPTFAYTGCHVVSVTDPYGRILGFLDLNRHFLFQVAPQVYSRGWVDPVPDPLLLRKSSRAGNRTRTSGSVARNSDH